MSRISAIADKLGLNEIQLLLSYASCFSDIIIPKASSIEHILDNMKYLISLDEKVIKEMENIFQEFIK